MGAAGSITRQDVSRARKDLSFFAEMVGRPLTAWQLEALRLEARQTLIVAPRQVGKSFSLGVLACWQAFRRRGQQILVMSSSEKSSGRLLDSVRELAAHPLLHASVDEEFKTRVTLDNGSRIESVTASPLQVRGASIDLLIIDEASFIPDDLLGAAALPVTMARPEAKVVIASTPWARAGLFWTWAQQGLDGTDPDMRTFTWSLSQAPWIVPSVVESMRKSLPPVQFRAEILGEWVGAGDAYFDQDDLDAAVADYPLQREGNGAEAVLGADWGRQRDAHAIVIAGLVDDYGVNGRPVIAVPYCETSRRRYELQVAEIEAIAGTWQLTVMSERVGVGAAPTEQLAARLAGRVTAVPTGQQLKEDAYGRVALLLAQRQLVLPRHPELLKQLAAVTATPTAGGGLRIGTRTESQHDDLADALCFAVLGLPGPGKLAEVPPRPVPDDVTWTETPGGIRVPVPLVTVRPDQSYALSGKISQCANCRGPYRAVLARCCHCQAPNPGYQAPQVQVQAPAAQPELAAADTPAGNSWNPDLMQCGRQEEHKYDGHRYDQCPHCNPGASGSRMPRPGPPGGGLPPGLAGRLGPFLGPGR